jgi:hypothetical protein
MMIFEWTDGDISKVCQLFESFNKGRALIFPAIDQKRCHLWVDSLETPSIALWKLKILNAIAGDSTNPAAEDLIRKVEPMQALFAPDHAWENLIRNIWGERTGIQQRTKLSPHALDIKFLQELSKNVPDGFTLERMDLETIKSLDKRLAMHIPLFFGGSREFFEMGVGFCIKHKGKVVSIASSFTPFINEFEIQVDTIDDPAYRRKGLATAVSASLIVYALVHNLIPHWDAANEKSVALALKLGYTNPESWQAFYLKPDS